MKKIISFALCLALVVITCAAAWAETTEDKAYNDLDVSGNFIVKWVCPEGYEMIEVQPDDGDGGFTVMALYPMEDNTGKPVMMIAIAPDELYAEVQRLNDLDDEALAEIEATFREEDEVEITYMETAYGTKIMVIKEVKDVVDFVDFYTIYLGYEIEMVLTQPEELANTSITDEQIATVIQFLSDMDFVPVEAEEEEAEEEYGCYTNENPEAAAYYSTWTADDGDWRIEVYDEDGGLKLMIVHKLGDNKEDIWEYSAELNPEKDALNTVPSGLYYRQDTVSGSWDETYYEDGDAIFTINDAEMLLWKDLKEDAGKDLEFTRIGNFFGGRWMKDDIEVVFSDWYDGQYDIRLYRRGDNGEILDNAILQGDYDADTDTVQASGSFGDGEEFTVTFSYDENRNVVWSENGESTVLEYSYFTD